MKVQAISAFVVGVLLCAAVVMMRELGTKRSPAAADSSDVPSAGGSQGLQQAPKLEPNQDAAGAHEVNAALVARLETLELAVKRLHPVRELDELRVRIAELERSMQNGQPAMTNPEPRSQASEIAVLKREIASLDRGADATRLKSGERPKPICSRSQRPKGAAAESVFVRNHGPTIGVPAIRLVALDSEGC